MLKTQGKKAPENTTYVLYYNFLVLVDYLFDGFDFSIFRGFLALRHWHNLSPEAIIS
jgi:hypothetical protein